MVSNKERIDNSFWRNDSATAKQIPSNVLFNGKKMWQLFGQMRAKFVIVGGNKWVKNHHFLLNYLSVLVNTNTILFTSVSVASGGNLPGHFAAR